PEYRAGVEERSRQYAIDHLDPNACRDQYLAFAREVVHRESPATMIMPEHHEPGRPLTWAEAEAHLGRVRPRIDDLSGATLGQGGRLAVGRPPVRAGAPPPRRPGGAPPRTRRDGVRGQTLAGRARPAAVHQPGVPGGAHGRADPPRTRPLVDAVHDPAGG